MHNPKNNQNFTLVENQEDLQDFYQHNKNAKWIAFDTEFVGEKRYFTQLCLVQVATTHGNYLIDTIKVQDLTPFLDMVVSPDILKITHAGENDYRILNTSYGVIPQNIFDTQISSAFVGYNFPVSFSKLVEKELGQQVSKAYTVTDWENRPFTQKQLKYALSDILPLYELYQRLVKALTASGRLDWAKEECAVFTRPEYFEKSPHKEALNSKLMSSLREKGQVFLIRLLSWREEIARKKDHSKEMILSSKLISPIIRCIPSGKKAMFEDRRIPDHIVRKHGDLFCDMYFETPKQWEKDLLKEIPRSNKHKDPKKEIVVEMLFLMLKYKCQEEGVSQAILFSKNELKGVGQNGRILKKILNGWRRKFLGEKMCDWLSNIDKLKMVFEGDSIELKMER